MARVVARVERPILCLDTGAKSLARCVELVLKSLP